MSVFTTYMYITSECYILYTDTNRGKKVIATAHAVEPSALLADLGSIWSANKPQGIEVSKPAPSPEMLSADVAPRCSIQLNACNDCLIILCVGLLLHVHKEMVDR